MTWKNPQISTVNRMVAGSNPARGASRLWGSVPDTFHTGDMGNSLARTDCLSVRGCISQQPKSWYMKLTSQILSLACLIPFGNVSCRRLQFPLAAVVLPLAH